MKKSCMSLVLAVATVFATGSGFADQVTVSSLDCASSEAKRIARKELGISRRTLNKACERLEKSVDPKVVASASPADQFREAISASICLDDVLRNRLANNVSLDPIAGAQICRDYLRELSVTSSNPGSGDNPFEGLSEFLDGITLERNPNAVVMRARFAAAYAPGLESQQFAAPFPNELFLDKNYRCQTIKPFRGIGDLNAAQPAMFALTMDETFPYSNIWTDGSGYLFNTLNGIPLRELSASDEATKQRIRSIRVEPACRRTAANGVQKCQFIDENGEKAYDRLNLIIEESVRGEGLLRLVGNWIASAGGIFTSAESVARDLLRSRSGKALNFWTDNNCDGSKLLTGCELAANYYLCTEVGGDDNGDF